jgi:hypothetical protein
MVDDLDSGAPLTLQQQQFKARAGFGCGLASGVIQAAVFNPYDRALYLTVSECHWNMHDVASASALASFCSSP